MWVAMNAMWTSINGVFGWHLRNVKMPDSHLVWWQEALAKSLSRVSTVILLDILRIDTTWYRPTIEYLHTFSAPEQHWPERTFHRLLNVTRALCEWLQSAKLVSQGLIVSVLQASCRMSLQLAADIPFFFCLLTMLSRLRIWGNEHMRTQT